LPFASKTEDSDKPAFYQEKHHVYFAERTYMLNFQPYIIGEKIKKAL